MLVFEANNCVTYKVIDRLDAYKRPAQTIIKESSLSGVQRIDTVHLSHSTAKITEENIALAVPAFYRNAKGL